MVEKHKLTERHKIKNKMAIEKLAIIS